MRMMLTAAVSALFLLTACSTTDDMGSGTPAPVTAADPAQTTSAQRTCTGQVPTADADTLQGSLAEATEITLTDNTVLYDDIVELTVNRPDAVSTTGEVVLQITARNISGAPRVPISTLVLTVNGRACALKEVDPGLSALAPPEASRVNVIVRFVTPHGGSDDSSLVLTDQVTGQIRAEWPLSGL
ncbi:hypothetical protein K0651_11160 [Ornithinimicrobium sp. Arc0846-15]|nr:hypothetical protein [Ornithinimicrobium laminariae]